MPMNTSVLYFSIIVIIAFVVNVSQSSYTTALQYNIRALSLCMYLYMCRFHLVHRYHLCRKTSHSIESTVEETLCCMFQLKSVNANNTFCILFNIKCIYFSAVSQIFHFPFYIFLNISAFLCFVLFKFFQEKNHPKRKYTYINILCCWSKVKRI